MPSTDARSSTSRSALAEPVEPRRDERVDRRRHRQRAELRGRAPAAVLARDQAVVDEHREQLLDEERIALGGGDERARRASALELDLAEQVVDQPTARLGVERLEQHRRSR